MSNFVGTKLLVLKNYSYSYTHTHARARTHAHNIKYKDKLCVNLINGTFTKDMVNP